jgi:cold shock CspA family protein
LSGLRRPHLGTVIAFDEQRGLGTIRAETGEEFPFHCTAIADGTRRIDVGRRVSFLEAPTHLGRFEARAVVALDGAG